MGSSESVYEVQTSGFWLSVAAEFVGTMLLVIFGCGSCAYEAIPLAIALSFGLSVSTVVWAIAHVSGGHINPAVTMGFLATRKMSFIKAFMYVVSQMSGAIIGAVILNSLYPESTFKGLCTPTPKTGTSAIVTFTVEFLVTFLLVFVVFATCDGQRKGFAGSGPLAIGLSVTVGHLMGMNLTGAGTNPARVFGPAVISGTFDRHWAYWIGPMAAGAVAGFIYDFLFAVNACTEKLKAFFTTADYNDADFKKVSCGINIPHS
ncbi:hypothetical protein HELRODRAFT_68110 [Helobdella robusta]|uniref:Aquaporin n=1 Tax=Helobdella robusta TaxID=6412 RepID=T1FZA3_HELRO|nr:hypothetical protein HELRODRAFT_68110 [Helobdella robusta]ESN96555.1 hypothetical protein HELRODRAFT_68110 [Helobdella robusta]